MYAVQHVAGLYIQVDYKKYVVNRLFDLNVNIISFWLGFLAGLLSITLIIILRKYLPNLIQITSRQLAKARAFITKSTDQRYRNDVVRYTQGLHLTHMFFSLDEIAIEPRLMAPPPQYCYHKTIPPIDSVQQSLPYIPDWPELAATYHAPTISIVEALSEHANIVLIGHPGSGKTFALAWLASGMARKDLAMAGLGEFLPIYFHAADIPYPNPSLLAEDRAETSQESNQSSDRPTKKAAPNSSQLLNILIAVLGSYTSVLTTPKLFALLEKSLINKRAMLIVDGLDELSQDQFDHVTKFLSRLMYLYPNNRVITTASFEYLDNISGLGLYPMAMASWGDEYKEKFIQQWDQQWRQLIMPTNQIPNREEPQLNFIKDWLLSKSASCTPFELTLMLWAAYYEDITSRDLPNLIEAYLSRTSEGLTGNRKALEKMAWEMVINQSLRIGQQDASRWMSDRGLRIATEPLAKERTKPQRILGQAERPRGNVTLSTLITNGLLISISDSYIKFSHPIIAGYLAARFISAANEIDLLHNQNDWIGKSLALKFLASFEDVSLLSETLIPNNDFLSRESLMIARWLSLYPTNTAWRIHVLRTLVNTLNKEPISLTLSAKIVVALSLSGEQGVAILFRQLLKSDNSQTRFLAILGCGLIHDVKAIDDLATFVEDSNSLIARAACLALIEIGDKNAFEKVVALLQHGKAVNRVAAAEALANEPRMGHQILEEGSRSHDLMIRRSVIFGLMRVKLPWAIKILETMQLEDKEWVVRSAAVQALEQILQPNPHIPHPLPPLEDLKWVVEFAARKGMGVPSGVKSTNIIPDILKSGSDDEKLAALEYLGLFNQYEFATSIYPLYFGSPGALREAAYQSLWLMTLTGVELPSPRIANR